jgi:hypothetical protein
MRFARQLYLQYGCGWSAPKGWLNFDASPTLRFERLPIIGHLYTRNTQRFPDNVLYGDIVRGLPIAAASCKGIYCSHVLEHLALTEFDIALQNTFTYLQPEGIFRLVVPDLEQLVRSYLSGTDPMASSRFMEETYLGKRDRARGVRGFLSAWLGNSTHLWMWDERSMTQKLKEHGFKQIRRATFQDSEDLRFNEVEEKGRFDGCLGMQCIK